MVGEVVVEDVTVIPEQSEIYLRVDLGGHEFVCTPADACNLIRALTEALALMKAAGWLAWEEKEE